MFGGLYAMPWLFGQNQQQHPTFITINNSDENSKSKIKEEEDDVDDFREDSKSAIRPSKYLAEKNNRNSKSRTSNNGDIFTKLYNDAIERRQRQQMIEREKELARVLNYSTTKTHSTSSINRYRSSNYQYNVKG